MKITWSVPVFGQGIGAGRGDLVRAGALVDSLRSRGHEVRVVEARRRPGRELEEAVHREVIGRVLPGRVRLALRDAAWWWRSRGHGRRVAEAAEEQGADVVVETHAHGVVSGSTAARSLGLPLVLDDVSPPGEPGRLATGFPALPRAAYRRQLEAASLLVAPTARVRKRVSAGGGGDVPTVRIVPNGVDLAAHRRASRGSGRSALGLGDEFVVGFVGSFQPWHDVSLLVRAFARLDTERPARLLLVGDGPGREPSLSEARERGVDDRVLAVGRVPPDRVPRLLAACDAGVLPGTNPYGHPMKLLEYAAAGLPLVAPDLPAVSEVVEGGRTGLLVPAGDPAELARALERLEGSPTLSRRLAERARREVASGEGWDARARRLSRALEEAAAGPRRTATARRT